MNKLLHQFNVMIQAVSGLLSYQETGDIPVDTLAYEVRGSFKKIGVL